ncbi:MAG: hypothetical protein KDD83_05555, partial [Caldilineaceae bacterium]|nr:hypothetical protein [Caldilineaceae bacterium]
MPVLPPVINATLPENRWKVTVKSCHKGRRARLRIEDWKIGLTGALVKMTRPGGQPNLQSLVF